MSSIKKTSNIRSNNTSYLDCCDITSNEFVIMIILLVILILVVYFNWDNIVKFFRLK